MRYIIILIYSIILIAFQSCNEDSLGIEENVRIIAMELPEQPQVIKTKFRADEGTADYFDLIVVEKREDSLNIRWTPLINDVFAMIDTADGIYRLSMDIYAQRDKMRDSLPEYMTSHIAALQFHLDTLEMKAEQAFERNNLNYRSKIHIRNIHENKMDGNNGNYLLNLFFDDPIIEQNAIIVKGKFKIKVPDSNSKKEYEYYFNCNFNLRFPLE